MFYSKLKQQNNLHTRRSLIFLFGKISLFSLIGWKLFNIQILNSRKYQTLSKKNQIRFEVLYPLRGDILDRNNTIIATNYNTYDLFLIPEQTLNIEKTLSKLNIVIKIDYNTRRKVVGLSKKVKKFQRIKILKNISWSDLEIIEANKYDLPGLHLQLVPQRTYPYSKYLSHILGYTSKPSEKDLNLPYITDMPSLEIGKIGIEKFFN